MARPQQVRKPNPFAYAQTAHLHGATRGTMVENKLSRNLAEIEETVDHTKPRIKVMYRDANGSKLRHATWEGKNVRIIPPDRARRLPWEN
jgi:hypothetical protein